MKNFSKDKRIDKDLIKKAIFTMQKLKVHKYNKTSKSVNLIIPDIEHIQEAQPKQKFTKKLNKTMFENKNYANLREQNTYFLDSYNKNVMERSKDKDRSQAFKDMVDIYKEKGYKIPTFSLDKNLFKPSGLLIDDKIMLKAIKNELVDHKTLEKEGGFLTNFLKCFIELLNQKAASNGGSTTVQFLEKQFRLQSEKKLPDLSADSYNLLELQQLNAKLKSENKKKEQYIESLKEVSVERKKEKPSASKFIFSKIKEETSTSYKLKIDKNKPPKSPVVFHTNLNSNRKSNMKEGQLKSKKRNSIAEIDFNSNLNRLCPSEDLQETLQSHDQNLINATTVCSNADSRTGNLGIHLETIEPKSNFMTLDSERKDKSSIPSSSFCRVIGTKQDSNRVKIIADTNDIISSYNETDAFEKNKTTNYKRESKPISNLQRRLNTIKSQSNKKFNLKLNKLSTNSKDGTPEVVVSVKSQPTNRVNLSNENIYILDRNVNTLDSNYYKSNVNLESFQTTDTNYHTTSNTIDTNYESIRDFNRKNTQGSLLSYLEVMHDKKRKIPLSKRSSFSKKYEQRSKSPTKKLNRFGLSLIKLKTTKFVKQIKSKSTNEEKEDAINEIYDDIKISKANIDESITQKILSYYIEKYNTSEKIESKMSRTINTSNLLKDIRETQYLVKRFSFDQVFKDYVQKVGYIDLNQDEIKEIR